MPEDTAYKKTKKNTDNDSGQDRNRRKRINRMKTVIIVVFTALILISIGLNIYLCIRVVHLSYMVKMITEQAGIII
ncbi:MAG: hypothetical protein IJ079_05285 [Lachnospiraceae bacterium]|nr:hypothetical protein [Lachnospiraceae bacterium]